MKNIFSSEDNTLKKTSCTKKRENVELISPKMYVTNVLSVSVSASVLGISLRSPKSDFQSLVQSSMNLFFPKNINGRICNECDKFKFLRFSGVPAFSLFLSHGSLTLNDSLSLVASMQSSNFVMARILFLEQPASGLLFYALQAAVTEYGGRPQFERISKVVMK